MDFETFSFEEDIKGTINDGEKLVNVGFGEYNTESLVRFRGTAAIVVGIIFVVVRFLILHLQGAHAISAKCSRFF